MGGVFSFLLGLFGSKEIKVCVLGLSNAGKTTILYKLHLGGEVVETTPTVGVNVEKVKVKNVGFGGTRKPAQELGKYFEETAVIIFVIDSSDTEKFPTVKKELFGLLNNEELKEAKILIFANKQDKEGSKNAEELTKNLNLHKIKSHDWHIQDCCALTGKGLKKGLTWILSKYGK